MIELEQYEGGLVYINPKYVSYIRQNTVVGYEHLSVIGVGETSIVVKGEANEIYRKISEITKPFILMKGFDPDEII